MAERLTPADAAQALDCVRWAVAEAAPLEIVGGGGKRALGRPTAGEHVLDLSGLSGVSLYEPDELVLTAGAGTPLVEIEGLLSQNRQQLAFEPADYGPLLGGGAGAQTLGGVIAANLSGPRRIKAGAARDHFLGIKAVSGRGDAVKSGGRVVKNVTGYDLCKPLAGSYGTLAAMTEITVKVLPAPEKIRTVLIFGLDDETAVAALSQAGGSPHEVSGLAHLPAAVAAASSVSYVAGAGASVTAIRVEGPGPSVDHRCRALREDLGGFGAVEELHSQNSRALWTEIRDVQPLLGDRDSNVWKLSVTPMTASGIVGRILGRTDGRALYDWAGGLVWLSLASAEDAHHAIVRDAVGGEGHATLMRAPAYVRWKVPVFQPQPPALAALSRRVKHSFDPQAILNRGRMFAEA